MFDAQFIGELARLEESIRIVDRTGFQFGVESLQVEGEVLNASLAELDVCVTNPFSNDGGIAPRHLEHTVGHIDPDDLAVRSDHLRRDEADFSRATAEVEDNFTGPQMGAGIASSILT